MEGVGDQGEGSESPEGPTGELGDFRKETREKYPAIQEAGHDGERPTSREYADDEAWIGRQEGGEYERNGEEENSEKERLGKEGSLDGGEKRSDDADGPRPDERTKISEPNVWHEERHDRLEELKDEVKQKYPEVEVVGATPREIRKSGIEVEHNDGVSDSSSNSADRVRKKVGLEIHDQSDNAKDDTSSKGIENGEKEPDNKSRVSAQSSNAVELRSTAGEDGGNAENDSQTESLRVEIEKAVRGPGNSNSSIDEQQSKEVRDSSTSHVPPRESLPVIIDNSERSKSAFSAEKSQQGSSPAFESTTQRSTKEETERVRVAGDESKPEIQLDSPDHRQAVLFLTPHFCSRNDAQFCLSKASLEIQTGRKLESGKLLEFKGRVEGIYEFHEYRFLSESNHIKIYVPKEHVKEMRAGEKKQVTIISIEDKKISDSVSEILSHLKRGQNWRYIANRTELSSKTTSNDLKWLTEPRVHRHRIPLEDSLRKSQGVSNEEWKRYLGKLLKRELSQHRTKESGTARNTRQPRSEMANRPKSEIATMAPTIKSDSGRKGESAPPAEPYGLNQVKDAPASAERTEPAKLVDRYGEGAIEKSQKEITRPGSWEWVAGFFDGEGTILMNVRKYSVGIEVSFAQKYTPLLDSVQEFLRHEGVKGSSISDDGNARRLSVHSTEEAAIVLRGMLPHLRLKENQARAALDYLEDRISGRELVQIFNQEVEAGRRSGSLRSLPDQPLHRTESIRRSREAQMKNAHHALHKPLDRLDNIPEV